MTPGDELFNLSLLAFDNELDIAVSAIPHPTLKSKSTRIVARGCAIVYALHAAVHDDMCSFHLLAVYPRSRNGASLPSCRAAGNPACVKAR